jgi:hypothetical protein
VKIQAKTNQMMRSIKNSPHTKKSRFFIHQTFPPKTKCLVLDLPFLCVGDRASWGLGGGGTGDVRRQRSWQGWRHRIPIPIDQQEDQSSEIKNRLTMTPFGEVY